MSENNDPRVFFAAERTLLAWIRTGLTIIAFGFVVARFGLFLQMVSGNNPHHSGLSTDTSFFIGTTLVLLGALGMLAACAQHVQFCKTLPTADLPASYLRWFAPLFGIIVGLGGMGIGALLLLSR